MPFLHFNSISKREKWKPKKSLKISTCENNEIQEIFTYSRVYCMMMYNMYYCFVLYVNPDGKYFVEHDWNCKGNLRTNSPGISLLHCIEKKFECLYVQTNLSDLFFARKRGGAEIPHDLSLITLETLNHPN